MSKIGEYADRNIILGTIRYQVNRVKFLPSYLNTRHAINKRKQGMIEEKFTKLLSLKNKYRDMRCFIIATGPSLTIHDVELLSNEVTFGVNSISKLTDMTEWRPTYLGIQDPFVYEKLENSILSSFTDNVFISDLLANKFSVPEDYIQFPYFNNYKNYMNGYLKYNAKFSDDASIIVYDGYSITYSMIQIAVYMGFKEIYLLGCDCSYPKGEKNHFVESGFIDRNAYLNYEKMTSAYKIAKEYADKNDVRIINCTRGGMLEIFPRMQLEQVLDTKM